MTKKMCNQKPIFCFRRTHTEWLVVCVYIKNTLNIIVTKWQNWHDLCMFTDESDSMQNKAETDIVN